MPLPIGAVVAVRSLGNKRGVVAEADRNGRYRIQVETVSVWCREEDLIAAPPGEKRRPANRAGRNTPSQIPDGPAPPGRVDLHGLPVEEALARVIEEIDRSLLRGADRVEVVHGKGAGRIRDALHRHLASMPVVAAFRLDPRNAGMTWVYF